MSKNNHHHNGNSSSFDGKHYEEPRRTAQDLLSFSTDDFMAKYRDDDDDNHHYHHDDDDRRERKNHDYDDNNYHNNHDNNNDRRDNHNQNDRNWKDNGGNMYKNPVCKILTNSDKIYDYDDVIKLLVNKDGLHQIIKDLKETRKDPSKIQNSAYVQRLLRDSLFASALPEALEEVFGEKFGKLDDDSRKELGYFMNEIVVFLNNSYKQNVTQNYDIEVIEAMRNSYCCILSKFNKKKVGKLIDKVKGMSKSCAKQIAMFTSDTPVSSIYQLVKFLYRESKSEEFFDVSVKSLTKLFKICYGKDNMNDAIKCLMLERAHDTNNMSETAIDISAKIDIVIRDYLESLDKDDIHKIIKDYVNDRKRQERNGAIPRRFGDRRTIHQDDYPKLTKALDNIESRDYSIIQYLR